MAVLLLVLVTQTSMGKEWVLREVLARVGGGVHGEILVESVSSPGLLNGFTFVGITIRGEDGKTFLEADSLRARVSGPALLRGAFILLTLCALPFVRWGCNATRGRSANARSTGPP